MVWRGADAAENDFFVYTTKLLFGSGGGRSCRWRGALFDFPVVDSGHGHLGGGDLVAEKVEVGVDLLDVGGGGRQVLGQQSLGLVQGVLQHHIGSQPQANLQVGFKGQFLMNVIWRQAAWMQKCE